MSLIVRRVETAAEREQLYAFRYRVYVQELHMTEDADHDRRWLYDALDEVGVSLAVFRDGDIVGCLRLVFMDDVDDLRPMIKKFDMGVALERFEPREITATSRFILDRELRHGKTIFRLIKAGYKEAARRGVRLNYGDCSPHQLAFYKHLGYRRYTRGYNDAAFGYKIPILMLVNDHAFLNQVRSPLFRLAAECRDDREARRWFDRVYPDYGDMESAATSAPSNWRRPASLTATVCRRRRSAHPPAKRSTEPSVIQNLGGNDVIRGLGGNDVVCGRLGNDRLFGGSGDDRLFGGAGAQPNGELGFDRCAVAPQPRAIQPLTASE